MDRGDEAKIEQMSACYRRIYESEYEDDEKILLLNFIRTYYQLTPDESTAFDERLGQEVNREVREMEKVHNAESLADLGLNGAA
jgi:hypothetical protein